MGWLQSLAHSVPNHHHRNLHMVVEWIMIYQMMLYLSFFRGHTCWWSGATPHFVFRDHFWLYGQATPGFMVKGHTWFDAQGPYLALCSGITPGGAWRTICSVSMKHYGGFHYIQGKGLNIYAIFLATNDVFLPNELWYTCQHNANSFWDVNHV